MKNITITILAGAAFLMSSLSNAGLIERDWQSAGDGLITYDESTGLEWLDITATQNRSYNDISSKLGVGLEFAGWQYATGNQYHTLWADTAYNTTNLNLQWYATSNYTPQEKSDLLLRAATILELTGLSYDSTLSGCVLTSTSKCYRENYGVLADSNGSNQWVTHLDSWWNTSGITEYSSTNFLLLGTHWTSWNKETVNSRAGHWLVREATSVPEPSTLAIFALGMIGLASRRFKKQS